MMNTRRILTAAGLWLILCGVAAAAPIQRINQIRRPLLSVPVIVESGREFDIRLDTEKTPERVSLARVSGPGERLELGFSVIERSGSEQVLRAEAPSDAEPALYDLLVAFADGSSDTQPHSVKLVDEFKSTFDFVHITDIHFNVERIGGEDMGRIRTRLLRDIHGFAPEFILFTGDLMLNPETYAEDYKHSYEQFLEHLEDPMFMVPGNHELYIDAQTEETLDGKPFWEATYGPSYHSFDYGELHFVGINSFDWEDRFRDRFEPENVFAGTILNARISPEQWEWLLSDLDAAHSAGRSSIAYTHIPVETLQGGRAPGGIFPPMVVTGPSFEEFKLKARRYGVTHVLVGHNHVNQEKDLGGIMQIMTQAAGIWPTPPWGFRVIHVVDGEIAGWTLHQIDFTDL